MMGVGGECRAQRLVLAGGERLWTVLGGDHRPVGPAKEYLRVQRVSSNTVKSYARALALWWQLPLPKTSSVQLMAHAGTREAPHRVGRVVVCQGSRSGQEPRGARAVAGAGGRSRCPDAAGARCRTARTPAGRAEGGPGSRSACGPVAHAGRSAPTAP